MAQLKIERWRVAPAADAHPHTSDYAKTFYPGRLGPTAWCLYQHFCEMLGQQPIMLDMDLLASWWGLGKGTGKNSPIMRSLDRLVLFHLAIGDLTAPEPYLAIRSTVPQMGWHAEQRMHPLLAEMHRLERRQSA